MTGPGAAFEGGHLSVVDATALRDQRELALIAIERISMPMVITDPRQDDNPIVLANRAFIELTGYSADEIIGRNCRFLQGPGTNAADLEAVRSGLKGRKNDIGVELLNYRKDGSTFWNQLSISAVHDAQGSLIYYFGSQKDVSARHRAETLEATERLLLREVDHRALNALSLVQSILHLSRTDSAEGFSHSVQRRVDALANAHRLLADSGWTGAYIADLLSMDAEPTEYIAEGDATLLPPSLVQPMAIVLQELFSNARQHGALRRGTGPVLLRWQSSPGQLILQWIETPGVLPHESLKPGLGLNLVKGIVERQLRGTIDLDWRDDSLKAEIALPIQEGY